jgi:hypothetical protein
MIIVVVDSDYKPQLGAGVGFGVNPSIFEIVDQTDNLKFQYLYHNHPSQIMSLINRFYTFKEKRIFTDLEKLKMIPMIFKQGLPEQMNICLMMILSEAHHLVKDVFVEFPYDNRNEKHKQCVREFIESASPFDRNPEMAMKIGRGAFSAAASLYYNSSYKNDPMKVLSCARTIKTIALIISAAYFKSFVMLENGETNEQLDQTDVSQLKGYFEKFYMKKDGNQIRHHRNIFFILKETHKLVSQTWIDGKPEVKNTVFKHFQYHLTVKTLYHPKIEMFKRLFSSVGSTNC